MVQQNNWRQRATAITSNPASDWKKRATAVQPTAPEIPQTEIGKLEAFGRGVKQGIWDQPTNVIEAAYEAGIGPESDTISFTDALAAATEESLSERDKLAQEQHGGYFTGGEIAGNIALTALPAAKATSLVGKAAPLVAKAPLVGKTLANVAKGVGASKGIVGIPAAGAIQGATQTLMTEGDLSGALPGAVGAGTLGVAGKLVKPLADDAISAARKGYTKTLQKIGIDDLTPGQMTGGSNLQLIDSTLEQMLPTANAARKQAEGQLRKFTRAALQKAGIKSDIFTPEVREMAEKQFNTQYDDLIQNTKVKIDEELLNKVVGVYEKNINKLPTNTRPIVQSYLDDIMNAGDGLPGKAYQVARSQMSKQANSMMNSDPFTAGVLKELRNGLDEAAERSLPQAKQGAWRELNKKYANFKILTKAISRPSQDSLEGLLSPAALNSVIETANKTKSTRSYNELFNLARSGRAVLASSVPNSGTAQRMLAQQLLTAGASGGAIGTGVYAGTEDPKLALYSALAATLLAPKVAQKALNTDAARTYFTKGVPLFNILSTPAARQLGAQTYTGTQKEE